MEYDSNPRRYYTAKFEPGVKVCRCCDNYRWSLKNKFLSTGLCKECQENLVTPVLRNPTPEAMMALPSAPPSECQLRARYQNLMARHEQMLRQQMPKCIRIISTEQVIAEKLALEAVGSKSL
jgi:hypothetical protein